MQDLDQLVRQTLAEIAAAVDIAALEAVRVGVLGRKGAITEQLKSLDSLPVEQPPAAGARINQARDGLGAAIDARREVLERAAVEAALRASAIDVTLPGRGQRPGGLHPATRTPLPIQALLRRA